MSDFQTFFCLSGKMCLMLSIQKKGGSGEGLNMLMWYSNISFWRNSLSLYSNKHLYLKAKASKLKYKKFGENSQLGLPPTDNSDLFEFQNVLKNAAPPSDQIQTIFNLRTYQLRKTPSDKHLKRVIYGNLHLKWEN